MEKFFTDKNYIKKHKINEFKELQNHTLILPKPYSVKREILNEYCSKQEITLIPKYEIASSTIMKKLVLNDVGVRFTTTEN